MATEKLVDADFVARLTQGSYETAIGIVDEAVIEQANLFGGVTAESVSTLATYPEHLIVATKGGDFYRAKWRIDEGQVVISDVEELDVPVFEAGSVGARVREESRQLAGMLMAGQVDEAVDGMVDMYRLFRSGVRLTAEGVEDYYGKQSFEEDDWFAATRESEKVIRGFLGTDAARLDVPKPKFTEAIEDETVDAEAIRTTVQAAVSRLKSRFDDMRKSLALARAVHEGYQLRGDADAMSTADFVDFVQGLSEALDSAVAILGDAEAVAEDGCVKCIARVHDGIASSAYEWVLATAFAEKLARRFEPPAAA